MSLAAQEEGLTRRVGAIALGVLALAIVFFVFVWSRIELGAPTRIKVYFHHVAGLRETAPLVVAGKTIGKVESIQTVPHGAATALGGEVGIVATVAIREGQAWKVPLDATIFISSHGPLSDKFLEVAPAGRDAAPGPPVTEGAELVAADPPSLDNVMQHTWNNMTTFRLFTSEVAPELTALRAQIDALRDNLTAASADAPAFAVVIANARGAIAEARTTYQVGLGGDAGAMQMSGMLADARGTLARTRAALAVVQPLADRLIADAQRTGKMIAADDPLGRLDAALARARAVLDKVDPLLAVVADVNDRLARGEGSLGLLMHDPEFPEDAKELGKIMKRQPWRIIAKPKD